VTRRLRAGPLAKTRADGTRRPPKAMTVAPAIKQAISWLLLQETFDLVGASRHANISVERLRDEINRPHTRKFLRYLRRAQIESACVKNPAVLAAIRDGSKNDMARVQAIRTSEAMRQSALEEDRGASARAIFPGLVIQIGGAARIEVQQPQRLGAARTITEAGAVDPALLEGEATEVILGGAKVAATPK